MYVEHLPRLMKEDLRTVARGALRSIAERRNRIGGTLPVIMHAMTVRSEGIEAVDATDGIKGFPPESWDKRIAQLFQVGDMHILAIFLFFEGSIGVVSTVEQAQKIKARAAITGTWEGIPGMQSSVCARIYWSPSQSETWASAVDAHNMVSMESKRTNTSGVDLEWVSFDPESTSGPTAES